MPTAAATRARHRQSGAASIVPYLVARADDGAAQNAHAPWRYEVKLDALARALDADARTRVAARIDSGGDLSVTVQDAPTAWRSRSRIDRWTCRRTSTDVRGDELRQVLGRAFGARAIRSTMFEFGDRDRETITFSGRGFGHGVGLCQAGAFRAHRRQAPRRMTSCATTTPDAHQPDRGAEARLQLSFQSFAGDSSSADAASDFTQLVIA